jgi:phenylacetate-CoA ligase
VLDPPGQLGSPTGATLMPRVPPRSMNCCMAPVYRKSGVIKLTMAMLPRKVPFEREPTAWDSRTEIRAFGQGLAMTEWLSPEELRSYQAPLVSKLLRHARKTTTFYKDRLAFNLGSRESIDKIWSEIPILTRAEAVQNRLKLISRHKLPRESGPITEGRTSGSTGMPLAFKKNDASSIAATAFTERMFRWWSVDGSKSFAQIAHDKNNEAPPPDGRTTHGWHSNHASGIKHFLAVKADVDTHLKWLMACRPVYFGSYPPVLKELAVAAQKRGIELEFTLLLSFATVLDEETRQLCRAAFSAEIADTYGAQEVDHIAAQCRECGEYHTSAEAAVVEVLRADGSAARPGEIGRIVVTPLYNYAMPFVRYALGDLAEVGSSPSLCGRGLPTLRRILGRDRNMFRFRDGTTVWPVPGSFGLRSLIALKQVQVVQTDPDRIEIRYVPDAPERPIDLAALTERVRAVLRQRVEVAVRSVDQIDRSPSGKYEECVSLVPFDLAPA